MNCLVTESGKTELKNQTRFIVLTKAMQHYLKQNNKQLLKNYDTKYPNTIEIFCRSKKEVEMCTTL